MYICSLLISSYSADIPVIGLFILPVKPLLLVVFGLREELAIPGLLVKPSYMGAG
jgi:hypothetical protein